MSIFFICPSNLRFMPYVSYYNKSLPEACIYIVWDRFSNEDPNPHGFIYKDGSYGHRRSFLSYLRFSFFLYSKIFKVIKKGDKIIIFGIQLTFFLSPFLFFTKKDYIIDVRDYHFLFKFIPSRIFKKASFVAISAPAYRKLFDSDVNCIASHNFYDYSNQVDYNDKYTIKPIVISYMGAIRDLSCQIKLIESLGNNNNFLIKFHGTGDIVPELKKYAKDNNIRNICFTGEYSKDSEFVFYQESSIINMLRESNDYNNRVALPNRLYSSAYFRRPCICYEGSAIAEIVKEYSLGICLKINDNIEDVIVEYFEGFSYDDFKANCIYFLNMIRKDQLLFQEELSVFLER